MPVPTSNGATLKRSTLRDNAYEAIKNAILDGTLQPGEQLDDRDLVDWLGVSRTPIREAIVLLSAEGFIDTAAQRHTRVAVPDPAQALEEVIAIGALMSSVIHQAVPALDDAGAAALIARVDQVAAAAHDQDAEKGVSALVSLHEAILNACPNSVLVRIVSDAFTVLAFHLRITTTADAFQWATLVANTEALSDAIRRRDAAAARAVLAAIHYAAPAP
ncbi:GntR family transcriptional regulator [Leucobacter musarum]|uniref:GntR family transcriptional regulator n=1 Tax=Leucobacter musarum TaxID=1930747 RepID=UPI0006A76847|nr:GntR family transcriptional regulator [Leucobacter musarum]